MEQIAMKFVQWDVPELAKLKDSKVYKLRERLDNGDKLSREEDSEAHVFVFKFVGQDADIDFVSGFQRCHQFVYLFFRVFPTGRKFCIYDVTIPIDIAVEVFVQESLYLVEVRFVFRSCVKNVCCTIRHNLKNFEFFTFPLVAFSYFRA